MILRIAVLVFWLTGSAHADAAVDYEVRYVDSRSGRVSVSMRPERAVTGPVALVMPRTYPGGYAQIPYDDYVVDVRAQAADGTRLPVARVPDAPRWLLGRAGDAIASVDYVIDVVRMEAAIRDAVSTSKRRNGYVGLLGYSVFGYFDGLTDEAVRLRVVAPRGWPVTSTLDPQVPARTDVIDVVATDYDELADSQILMGPRCRLTKLDGVIPLVVALYAEGPADATVEAHLAREALDRVQAYFGDRPIRSYTAQLEFLRPVPGHDYGFSQEHIASGTFSLAVADALTSASDERERERSEFNFAHHIAHSWIPKRVYGEGYRPFTWEMAPVIDTVWFNEGFGRYAAIAALADAMPRERADAFRAAHLARLRTIVDTAPSFIRRMPLSLLSREASLLYSADFRTGSNVFARGALMAADMDNRIQSATGGRRSLRDALRWLLDWSATHRAAFATEDLPGYFETATGVPVADILDRWQRPLEVP